MRSNTENAKQHRVHKKGGKVLKKKSRKSGDATAQSGNNPKAFKFRSAIKAQKLIRRAADLSEKKKHIPIVDRSPDVLPPLLVAIVGPPGVGKSTLLRCLVKNYVKQSLSEIKGPVTVVTSKKRRVTFFEVPNDINAMVDAAKIADLALILIDASFGFEMEVFEFINICQVHGMPKVIGVLTHMDNVPKRSQLKSIKKQLKNRFWSELYQGAKLFYLTGMQKQRYLQHEIKNLGRFISVAKLRPILWRNSHPYVFCDRFEDITDPELIRSDPKVSRSVSLYGYVRGVHLKNNSAVHLPGVGDFRVRRITILSDPCPLPANRTAKRTLNEREQIVYAPMSGLGGLVYDKDAVYIDIGGSKSFSKARNRDEFIEALEGIKEPLDSKMEKATLKLLKENPDLELTDVTNDLINKNGMESAQSSLSDGDEGQSEGEEDEQEEGPPAERTTDSQSELYHLASKFSKNFSVLPSQRTNWAKLVYETNLENQTIESEQNVKAKTEKQQKTFGGGLFRVSESFLNANDKSLLKNQEDGLLANFRLFCSVGQLDWKSEEVRESIKDSWVTGKWASDGGGEDDESDGEGKNDDGQSQCNDKEEKWKAKEEENGDELSDWSGDEFEPNELREAGEAMTKRDEGESSEDDEEEEAEEETKAEKGQNAEKSDGVAKGAKKERLRKLFDAEFDQTNEQYNALVEEMDKQSKLNKSVFDDLDEEQRQKLEGFRPGLYIRVEVEGVPAAFVDCFNPTFPYIVGGLLPAEQNDGYVQVRIKKHRWYDRLLKSRDPLIISCGWRRFQSMVVYSVLDHNHRLRFFKYTPKEAFCHGAFWAPFVTQNTGFLCLQSVDEEKKGFRIAATGVVLGMDKSTNIVKKLKLIGQPLEVFKKTAFVKGMFNSALEVTPFQGVAIRTVSGIRGLIKKALREPEGAFRATFEDKIKPNDVIFLRSWVDVPVPKFCVSMTDKLLPSDENWLGMKTTGRLRHELGIKPEQKADSGYHRHMKNEATEKFFVSAPLVIPKKLQKDLPYKLKPKVGRLCLEDAEEGRDSELVRNHTAELLMEPEENRVNAMMELLRTVKEEKRQRDKAQTKERWEKHQKELSEIEARRKRKMMATKKTVCRNMSRREGKRKRGDNTTEMETIGA
ncbi:hypothetical protein niasHS_013483 [Heterodera schachtii]|uniref:Bms1-type G domain-containing protein n=1 Tax=Heterodera schachtii TaxID=97005 RepID=A0ABD2I918_HETSC